jgi:hypothetical protein
MEKGRKGGDCFSQRNLPRQGGTGILPVITAGDGSVIEFHRLRRLPRSSQRRFLLWEGSLAANVELRIEFCTGLRHDVGA